MKWRQTHNAKRAILIVFTIGAFHTLPFLYTAGFGEICLCSSVYGSTTFHKFWAWENFLIIFVLPFFGLIFMNTSIVRKIHENKLCSPKKQTKSNIFKLKILRKQNYLVEPVSPRSTDSSHQPEMPHSKGHDRQLTVTMLCVTSAFIILALPVYVRHVIFSFEDITSDPHEVASATLLYHVTNKAFYTNSAINFCLYMTSGKPKYIFNVDYTSNQAKSHYII